MQDYIYLITVFEKCEPKPDPYFYNLGDTRSVGFRWSLEDAMDVVESNMCDIWEGCYDYACIEQLNSSLYPFAEERWFYEFDHGTDSYHEIDEPFILKNHGPIGGIG